ncbi:nuclear transport factor 2 family protein [Pseudomonas panipatensis]|uniref:Steroid delta-isomerase n=1 Tax=Pseudomonas panipatensis TaxID=428992 RepID=A0A1G8ELQ8_9PSED|nr:nuclear transport factor 2 family protein [Pseudomonas panipatensis]SDH70649.1 steroid delta-isomerase [Pseudomonas panipatensis]SMP68320.1 steroid delta-isomerase [Pseudomonas panipatensis]
MDTQLIRRRMARYVEMVDAGDIDGILGLYADDAVIEDPVGTPALVGLQAIARFYREGLGRTEASAQLTGPVRVAGNGCAAMPMRVDLMWNGEPCSLHVIDVMEFDDKGRIRSMKAYWGELNVERRPE